MAEGKKRIEKYHITQKIEESNYAIIYKVKDPNKKSLILKIARTKSDEYNELISREHQILSQFKHPNIVSVFEYDMTKDERAYFTLEYISGKPINKYFRGFSEELVSVIIQLINGLGAFHNKGFIHSDLKPEHILYNQNEKKAVLIDFGFAGIPTRTTKFAGTFGYMAPEVIKGVDIDQRSDLYSLGVIIYEILSGKKLAEPFVGIKEIPEEINKTIARLTSKESVIRPTIPELYQTFSKYLTTIKVKIPGYTVELPNTGFVEIPEIVEKLLVTRRKAIIVYGDTGTGKTRLLQEMKFKYLMQGFSVLHYISREKTKFYEFLQNFIEGKKFDFSDKEDKFQIFEEITTEFISLAKNKHLIILVDDIEKLSDYELALFRYVGYGIQGTNILLIGTSKLDERVKELGFEGLCLKPFSIDEIKKLLEKTFFKIVQAKAVGISYLTNFIGWLHKQSGGNPLFIVEILKTLYENEVISYRANAWQINIDLLYKTSIPLKIEKLLEIRLKKLGDNEIDILKILCFADYPLEPATINMVLKSRDEIEIEHLKNFGLLKEKIVNNRRVVYIPNQILVQLIEKKISKKEKSYYYKDLVKIIENTAAENKGYLPVLARLCNRFGNKEKAYKYFQLLLKNAESIYDYDSAIKYYEIMLGYEKEIFPKKYPETLIKTAQINQIIGNSKIAIEYYNKTLTYKRKDLAPVVYSGMAQVYSAIGQYSKAVNFLKKVTTLTKSREAQDFVKITVYSLLYLAKSEDLKIILNQSFLSSKKANNAEILAETMYYQTLYEWLKGNFDKGIQKAKENLKFTRENSFLKQSAYMENLLSLLYQEKGDINKAQKYLKKAVKRFKEMKLVNALVNALNNQACLYMCQGNFSKAKELFENVLILAHQTNNRTAQYISLENLGSISENLGKFNEAIDFYNRALKIKPDAIMPNYNLAMVLYKKGEINKAKSLIQKKSARKEEISYIFAMAMIDFILGEAEHAEAALNKGLELTKSENPNIETKINYFLKAAQFYYEKRNFNKSLHFSGKILKLTHALSREYNIAGAFVKINKFILKQINNIDITKETEKLKKTGCIYDYAYLKKVRIESIMNKGIKHKEIKNIVEELNRVQEIFASIGAQLELNRIEKIQVKLFPIIVRGYAKRVISVEYLETFSRLAELINTHLGDEDFIQNILDLIIQATNAERGALYIKTFKSMKFVVGRDIDRATIKDARELSRSIIKETEKDKIIFTEDALSDPNFKMRKSVILNQIRSLLCIPLSISKNVIGAIYLDSRIVSGIFGHKDKDFLLTVSRILASVIEKSEAFRSLTKENILLKSKIIEEIGAGYIIGKSACMKKVYRLIEDVAQVNSPVLILGETGTGKGMLARFIHLKSKRRNKRFLTINCGTIPETLLESELFGHKRGSFTGAVADKRGLLEEAESGTIFLDEIANTSPSFQAKFLEAIEEKKIRRIGETKIRKIDVRFLFASNRDLEAEVKEGRFRKDLFYRVNVFRIDIPPLRKRAGDIPLLARFFLERYSKEINKDIKGFSPDAVQTLKDYHWPGNVRELQNVIERTVVLAKGRSVTAQDLGFERLFGKKVIPLKELRKKAIIEALNINNWNIKKTAKQLGIGRVTLWRYIKEYKIKE